MLHRAWNSKGEMPYCIPRSSIKFQGHTALKIVQFDPNWAFPDCNFSLNSPMAMKCCTELETTKERCPIVFQGHPSNFKVTRDKTSLILSQIGHFRTIGRSQLSNPSDLPCYSSTVLLMQSTMTQQLINQVIFHWHIIHKVWPFALLATHPTTLWELAWHLHQPPREYLQGWLCATSQPWKGLV